MAPKVKQALTITAKIGLAAGLIFWMVREGGLDLNAFVSIAEPWFVVASLLFIFLPIFLNNIRWLLLLIGQGVPTTNRRTLSLSLIGLFFNYAVPGGVGGDVVKGYYLLQDHPHKKVGAAVSIFMDRILGLFVIICIAAVAVLVNWEVVSANVQLRLLAWSILAVFGAFLFFFALAFSRRVQRARLLHFVFQKLPGGHLLKEIFAAVHLYRKTPRILLGAFLLTVVSQSLFILFCYFVGQRLNVTEVPLEAYFFLVPLGTVAMALPIAPGGIGVGQAAFYFLFNLYIGHESPLGPTAVTSLQILQFCWGLLGAWLYLQRRKPAMKEAAS